MTLKQQKKPINRTFFLIPAILLLSISLPNIYAGDFGYQATNPNGGEVKKVKGDMWTYLSGLSTTNKHVDRIFYITDTGDFSVGVGYYDSTNGVPTESYKWLRYWDEGGVNNNFHFLSATGPSSAGWHSFEVLEVDANTYDLKVDGSSLGTRDCSTASCPNPTIAGVASWGTSTSSSDFVKADFKNLQHDVGTGYKGWQAESTDYKCQNSPSSVGFNKVVDTSMNQIQIDLGATDECSIDLSVWLYNSGGGG